MRSEVQNHFQETTAGGTLNADYLTLDPHRIKPDQPVQQGQPDNPLRVLQRDRQLHKESVNHGVENAVSSAAHIYFPTPNIILSQSKFKCFVPPVESAVPTASSTNNTLLPLAIWEYTLVFRD